MNKPRKIEYIGKLNVPVWVNPDGTFVFAHGTPEMESWKRQMEETGDVMQIKKLASESQNDRQNEHGIN